MERTIRIDDLDGTSTAEETIRFSLDDEFRTIDLSAENAQAFYKLMEPYLNASQPWSPTKATPKPTMTKDERAAITEWAKTIGVDVAPRGRIPQDLVDRFKAAQEAEGHATVEQIEQAIKAGEESTQAPVEGEDVEPTSDVQVPTAGRSRRK